MGLAPNQRGATNPDHVRNFLNGNPDLSALRDAHGDNNNRYFYTERYGWTDIRHFAESSNMVNSGWYGEVVRFLGFGNEIVQWCSEWQDDYRSGFSPEDLPSNDAGINFARSLNPGDNLGDAFGRWAGVNGARDANDPTSGFNQLPLDDPSASGGQGRGSSNPTSAGVNARGQRAEPMPPYIYF